MAPEFVVLSRQNTPANQGGGNVVSGRLISWKVGGALAGHYGRDRLLREAIFLGDRDMGIDLVGGVEVGAGDQDRDLPASIRQGRLCRQNLRELPNRGADPGLMQPWVPGSRQGAVVPLGFETAELGFNPRLMSS